MVEDVHHFLMDCSSYNSKRAILLARVRSVFDASHSTGRFDGLDTVEQSHILLGKRFDDPNAEDKVDRAVKKFLTKAWNIRKPTTDIVNTVLHTSYDVFTNTRGKPCVSSRNMRRAM